MWEVSLIFEMFRSASFFNQCKKNLLNSSTRWRIQSALQFVLYHGGIRRGSGGVQVLSVMFRTLSFFLHAARPPSVWMKPWCHSESHRSLPLIQHTQSSGKKNERKKERKKETSLKTPSRGLQQRIGYPTLALIARAEFFFIFFQKKSHNATCSPSQPPPPTSLPTLGRRSPPTSRSSAGDVNDTT